MQQIDIASTYNTFFHLVKELETFVDTSGLKMAFDSERNAYIIGNGFTEQIEANFASHREVSKAIREIISKHCLRIHPQS